MLVLKSRCAEVGGNGKPAGGWPRRRVVAGWLVYLSLAAPAVAQDQAAPAPQPSLAADELVRPAAVLPADEPLLALLAGEFALQEGATREAADHYAQAALSARDPRVAERAARLGLMADQPKATETALARWRELDPDAIALAQIELAVALRAGSAAPARRAMNTLLAADDGWKSALQVIAAEQKSLLARTLLSELVTRPAIVGDLDSLLAVGSLAARLELHGVSATVGARAVREYPQDARAWLWKAEVARQQDDRGLARQAIASALALPELSVELRMTAAGMLAALDEPAAAAEALAGGEQTTAVLASRAAYLSRADDSAALQALYVELQTPEPPTDGERLYLLGQLAELLEHTAEAVAWYGQIIDPAQRDQARLRLAVLADQQGDLAQAVELLRQVQGAESDDGRAMIDAHLLEAELQFKAGHDDLGMEAYARGLAVFEDEPALLYARAMAAERLDRVEQAEADFRRILANDPDSVDALNALGYTLADRTDRLDEAHALIVRALKAQPDNPAIIDSMGWVLFRLGRVEEALPHLRRAFELQRDAEVAAHLGEALWANGKLDEARVIWRLGLEIDPDNRALKRAVAAHPLEP